MKRIVSVLLCIISLCGCNPTDLTFNLSMSKIRLFSYRGGECKVTVTSDGPWTISVEEDAMQWCSVEPGRGEAGVHEVIVKVSANGVDGRREAVLTLSSEGNQKAYVVSQDPERYASLDQTKFEVDPQGENLQITVSTNAELTVADKPSWVTGMAVNEVDDKIRLDIKIDRNMSFQDRTGEIYLSHLQQDPYLVKIIITQKSLIIKSLREFYNATGGETWTRKDYWFTDASPSTWYGLGFDEGFLSSIVLPSNNLSGDFEECFQKLFPISERLRSVDLGHNGFYGELPENPDVIKNISYFDVEYNQLTGNLPESFQNLTTIRLAGNKLSGDISSYRFTGETIFLQNNEFSGGLPEYPENSRVLNLSNNNFTGTIPASHAKAFENKGLYEEYGIVYNVDNNMLSGDLPSAMTSHPNWHVHWFDVMSQKTGYGFNATPLPAHSNTVKCYDGTMLDLGEEYGRNKYTMLFRWDPHCIWSQGALEKVVELYKDYKDKGLGLVCMTHYYESSENMMPLTSAFPDVKTFWESHEPYDNNPYSQGSYFFLFRTGFTPYIYIVDSRGDIACFGSGGFNSGTIPQYRAEIEEIYRFVASAFE